MKENAAEACATQCKAEQDAAQAAALGKDVPVREAYDTCYTKCVAQETKEVAEEREKVCALGVHLPLLAHMAAAMALLMQLVASLLKSLSGLRSLMSSHSRACTTKQCSPLLGSTSRA